MSIETHCHNDTHPITGLVIILSGSFHYGNIIHNTWGMVKDVPHGSHYATL